MKNNILTEIEKKEKLLFERPLEDDIIHQRQDQSLLSSISKFNQSYSEEFGTYLLHLGGSQNQSKTKCI